MGFPMSFNNFKQFLKRKLRKAEFQKDFCMSRNANSPELSIVVYDALAVVTASLVFLFAVYLALATGLGLAVTADMAESGAEITGLEVTTGWGHVYIFHSLINLCMNDLVSEYQQYQDA